MTTAHREGFCCGRRSAGLGLGGREPFAFPGTTRRYAPDRSADIRHTLIEITLDPAVVHIAGRVSHTVTALHDDTTTLALHADELTITGAETESGAALRFEHVGEGLTVHLAEPLKAGAETTVRISYEGTPRRGIYFISPDSGYPDKPVQAWTQGQDEDSRFWFPCFDHPSEKMSTELRARVPAKYTVVGNGALVGKETQDDGTIIWHWKQAIPHSAYLVTLAVGEFDELVLEGGDVPLTAYVPHGTRALAERAFGRTAAMIACFEEHYGVRYPYEKYAQVVVEGFICGGMENTSATTLFDVVLYDYRAALDFDMDDLVAHELAHQWWGDLLTCRDWSHAWLNEGFATWSEVVWKAKDKGEDEADYDRLMMLKEYQSEDGGEYRRSIVEQRFDEPIDLFDRHLYQKGGLVLHMLRRELGEEPFWRAIRTYATEYRGRTVVTEDLRRAVELATGRNLDWYFDQWIYGAGHPDLEVSQKHDSKQGRLAVTVTQTHKGDAQTAETFRFDADLEVRFADGTVRTERLQMRRRSQTFHIEAAEAPVVVLFDPRGDLLASVKEERPAGQSRAALAGTDVPMRSRVRAAHELAKKTTAENLGALARALADPFWGVASEAAKALGSTRHPVARDALLDALPQTTHPKVRRAIVVALGSFRHDDRAGAALLAVVETGDESLFVESAAATALGQTRVAGAREALTLALETRDSWAESVRMGCIRGLAALGTEAVVPTLLEWGAYGRPTRVRATVAAALATVGRRLTVRTPILEALSDLLRDGDFRLVMASIQALRQLGDEDGIGVLGTAPMAHADGRVRRAARVAASRIRKGGTRNTELARISDEVEKMRKENAELRSRLDQMDASQKD